MGGGAVDADRAGSRLSRDDVSGQPRPVRDVINVDLFVLDQVRRLRQLAVDSNTTLRVYAAPSGAIWRRLR
jgi:hypothetical protein